MKAPAADLMRNLGLQPDPWQVEVLDSPRSRMLLNCCRQAGKSTVVALLALAEALWVPGSRAIIVSRSLRQSTELFRIVTEFYGRLGSPIKKRLTRGELLLGNTSRIVCLPCKEETIRGFSNVSLLILDEAARVPDDLYRAVRPMLAVSRGRMICLSTPRGKRGFFFETWTKGADDWYRIEVPATKIPRISPEHLAQERRSMGDSWFRQEYCCSFEALEGVVYPHLHTCVVPLEQTRGQGEEGTRGKAPGSLSSAPGVPKQFKRKVGGMDFGYRNPFAAIWGGIDNDGVLWLTHEHYCRQQPLSYHAARLPRDVTWYADPHGASEIAELRVAGFTVKPGIAFIRPGIAAVQARIRNGTLRILEGACPNLVAEAGLYRYDDAPQERWGEQPIGEYDHALDALRYLILRLDQHRLARPTAPDSPLLPNPVPPTPNNAPTIWQQLRDHEGWTRLS